MRNMLEIENELKSNIKRVCPLCSAKIGWLVSTKDGVLSDHKIWCKKCGLIYRDIMMSEKDNGIFYNKYYLEKYSTWPDDGEGGRENHFKYGQKRRFVDVKTVKEHIRNAKKPIEIGCSSGGVLSLLVKHNKNIIGIDIDEPAIEYAVKKGLPAVIMDIYKTKRKFDLIYCSHVIEHLIDPRNFIQQFQRISLPNGKLIALVPDGLKNPEGPYVPHVMSFSKRTFIQMVEENSDFRVSEVLKDDVSIFIIFERSGNKKMFNDFLTSEQAYEDYMRRHWSTMFHPIRKSYDCSDSKEELSLLRRQYKDLAKQGRIPVLKRLIWSKLYRFFTGKWIKTS